MPATLSKALQIKPAMRILLLNSPPGYERLLGELPAGAVVVADPRGPVDLVQLFCRSMAELKEGLPRATERIKGGGVLWICWPKPGTEVAMDLDRDILWRVMLQAHYRPVAGVAIDGVWSGLRFESTA